MPILAAAAPDCKPGCPVVVVAGLTPAVPLGVGAVENGAGTTVMAVTVLWLPSGRVVVCRIVEVIEPEAAPWEEGAAVVAAPDPPADDAKVSVVDGREVSVEGERVTKPPPMVLTIVTPDPSVVVMTDPGAVATTVVVEPPPTDDPATVGAAALD